MITGEGAGGLPSATEAVVAAEAYGAPPTELLIDEPQLAVAGIAEEVTASAEGTAVPVDETVEVTGDAAAAVTNTPPRHRGVHGPEQWTPQKIAFIQQLYTDSKIHRLVRSRAAMYTRGDADDLMQELVMRLARSARQFDASSEGVYGLAATTLRWILTDALRSTQVRTVDEYGDEVWRSRELTLDLEDPTTSPAALLEDEVLGIGVESRVALGDAIDGLSRSHRHIIKECYFGGLTMSEAADKLNLPLGTAKSRMFYALKALRERLLAQDWF